jgi:DNA mismatch repair ATPase MutS
MLLKQAIEEIGGLRHVIDRLETRSGAARRVLLDTPWMTSGEEIRRELDLVERLLPFGAWPAVASPLGRVKDIRGTIQRLATGETPDDVELFEVKSFALLAGEIAGAVRAAGVTVVDIPDLEEVVDILDPDGSRLPRFYIHDAYSPELARLRALLKAHGGEETRLFVASAAEEDRVRERLGARLRVHHPVLAAALDAVTRLDILLAKARLARETGGCKPVVSDGITRYEGLFHPRVREALRERGREFQPVDVAFDRETCLVTGANMGGKSVLLKSLALAQALFQYGFHVPATRAMIVPVDAILLSLDDGQDEARGISSFAAEILRLDRIVREMRGSANALVLLDEPARCTNPAEGAAIVNALAEILSASRVRAFITTHYDIPRAPCRKLRVKGLDDCRADETLSPRDLHERMDYSLVEDGTGQVPREATRVAEMLGVDAGVIERIKWYLNETISNNLRSV